MNIISSEGILDIEYLGDLQTNCFYPETHALNYRDFDIYDEVKVSFVV